MQSVNPSGSGPITDWKAVGGDKKIVSGILAILLGALGIHKFILVTPPKALSCWS
jgi:hypothetical protein